MDSISYRGVYMPIIQSLGWERDDLHDPSNTTYECTRYRCSAIVSLNPGAISYRSPVIAGQTPVAQSGNMPVDTDLAIRHFLSQPRGLLIVVSNGTTWVESPAIFRGTRNACDVRNGPFVKVNSIVQIPGERLWQVHLTIETYLNERPGAFASSLPPLMVSNRWYAADDTNWQHLRTRVYQGICTVRGDVLRRNVFPENQVDFIRPAFCAFSVPPGFQRERVQVTVTPDGNTAHYTVVDVEKLFNQTSRSPAVRIECADSDWTWSGSWFRAVAHSGGTAGGLVGGNNFFTGGFGGMVNQVSILSNNVAANLPKAYKNVLVRCWGNRLTSRNDLVLFALRVARTRMSNYSRPLIDTTMGEFVVSQDTNNMVQVSHTITYGTDVAAGFIGGVPGTIAAAADLFLNLGVLTQDQNAFNQSIGADPNFTVNSPNAGAITISQEARTNNPPFPAGAGANGPNSGTRGTSAVNPVGLQLLVSQTLEGFDENTGSVP